MPRNYSTSLTCLVVSISVLAVAACSSDRTKSSKADVPMPPVTETATAEPAAPAPLSSSDTLTPIFPPVSASATTPMMESAQAPVEIQPAPSGGASDMESRIARLEQAVGSLRTDYDRIMPAFASLNTTNERIQALLDEMERETGRRPVAASIAPAAQPDVQPVVQTAPAEQKVAPSAAVATANPPTKASTVSAPVTKSAASVSALRIGEHGTKTRLVLDLTAPSKPDFKYDLDNAEKLLLVDLPSTGWSGAASGNGGAVSPLVASWSTQGGDNGGTSLAVQLKASARVLSTQFLPAADGNPARLVIDIASGA